MSILVSDDAAETYRLGEVRREAQAAELDAAVTEVELRKWQLIEAEDPGKDAKDFVDDLKPKAAARRTRADALAERAGLAGLDLIDLRFDFVERLRSAETKQLMFTERYENISIYAVDEDEAGKVPSNPSFPPPRTVDQITAEWRMNKCYIQALTDWLAEHPAPAPVPTDSDDAATRLSVELVRTYLKATAPELVDPDDDLTDSEAEAAQLAAQEQAELDDMAKADAEADG